MDHYAGYDWVCDASFSSHEHGVLHLMDQGFSQMQAASVLSFLIFGSGYVFEKTGNYDLVFIILTVVLSICFVLSFFLAPPVKK